MGRYLKLLGFALLGVILWRADLSSLGRVLAECAPLPVVLALLLSFVSLGFKVARWNSMLGSLGYTYSFPRACSIFMTGVYLGLATPGRLGEVTRALYVKRDFGASAGLGLATVVVDRLFDLYTLIAVGFVASFVFGLAGRFSAVFLVCVALFLAAPFLLLNRKLGSWFTRRLGRLASRKFGEVLAEETGDFYSAIEQLMSPGLALWAVLTLLAYAVFFAAGFSIVRGLGVEISFVDTTLVLGLSNLLSLVPITVAGVGTRDAVFVFCFGSLGLGAAEALAFSALVLALFYLGGGLIGFGCFVLDRPPEVGDE